MSWSDVARQTAALRLAQMCTTSAQASVVLHLSAMLSAQHPPWPLQRLLLPMPGKAVKESDLGVEYLVQGTCKRGDVCPFAHGVFESWLHPGK